MSGEMGTSVTGSKFIKFLSHSIVIYGKFLAEVVSIKEKFWLNNQTALSNYCGTLSLSESVYTKIGTDKRC